MHVTERGLKRSWMKVDTRMETKEKKRKNSDVIERAREINGKEKEIE